jgi:hypothetical protein
MIFEHICKTINVYHGALVFSFIKMEIDQILERFTNALNGSLHGAGFNVLDHSGIVNHAFLYIHTLPSIPLHARD